jgi:hypothetical protein
VSDGGLFIITADIGFCCHDVVFQRQEMFKCALHEIKSALVITSALFAL